MINKKTAINRRILRDIHDHFWMKILAFAMRRLDAKKVTVDYDSLLNMTMIWIYWKDETHGND